MKKNPASSFLRFTVPSVYWRANDKVGSRGSCTFFQGKRAFRLTAPVLVRGHCPTNLLACSFRLQVQALAAALAAELARQCQRREVAATATYVKYQTLHACVLIFFKKKCMIAVIARPHQKKSRMKVQNMPSRQVIINCSCSLGFHCQVMAITTSNCQHKSASCDFFSHNLSTFQLVMILPLCSKSVCPSSRPILVLYICCTFIKKKIDAFRSTFHEFKFPSSQIEQEPHMSRSPYATKRAIYTNHLQSFREERAFGSRCLCSISGILAGESNEHKQLTTQLYQFFLSSRPFTHEDYPQPTSFIQSKPVGSAIQGCSPTVRSRAAWLVWSLHGHLTRP